MENEVLDLVRKIVRKIVDTYMKDGPSKALKLSRKAIEDHAGLPLLHRLHAMYVFESDRSEISSALAHACRAVAMYPRSLEYRFFYISLLCNKVDATDVTEKMFIVFECENALSIVGAQEPYWELYMDDDRSGEEAVEYVKICLRNMVDLYHREADALGQDFLDAILLSSSSSSYSNSSHEKLMKITGDMINGDLYHSCGFVQRMHSEFCFQSAMGVEDGEERKRFLLDRALCSAKTAHIVFDASIDYFVNLYTRTLQCSDHLSLINLRMAKHRLTKALDFEYSKEPYYKYLIKDNITDQRELPEYYKNCIRLLLTFIRTLEERRAINDDNEEFISIYYKYLEESDLRNFAEESNFFRENIKYLLDNRPKMMIADEDRQTRDDVITSELGDIVGEIVDTYKKEGPSEARQLTHDALQIYKSSSILLRLHAKYTFENDRSEIESALKFAKMAVLSCPQSLEHRFFHASLLYNKATTASPKDNMLYWEIVSECDEALMDLERPVDPLWVLHMVDKKTEGMKSEEEAVEYVKTCLRNLINMCYRAIDAVPKGLLDTLRQLDIEASLMSINIMLNCKRRFCAFVHRMYSDFCFEYAQEMVNNGMRMKWLTMAHISAKSANESFRSTEYAINLLTRKLQFFNFDRTQLQLMKETLENCLGDTNNHEPYYKHLVDNNLTNHAEQRDYFKNCIGLLQAFIRMIEQIAADQNFENDQDPAEKEGSARKRIRTENNHKIYYGLLDEYNLRDFAGQSIFFNKNIKYLLENPPKVLPLEEDVMDKSGDAKESSEEKKRKKKKKKKKNKRKAKGLMEVDFEAKEDAVNECEDAKEEDLSQHMDAKLIVQ